MGAGRRFVWMAFAVLVMLSAGKALFAQRTAGSEPLGTVQPVNKDAGAQPTEPVQNAPVSKQEAKAYKAFHDAPASDADKKTQLGEDFIQNYPQSRNRPEVVTWLARAYLLKGQLDKLQAEAEKEAALTPPNPISLAVLGSNLARAVTPSTPDADKHLDQAEQYCKLSLQTLETAKRPDDIAEDKFKEAKNQTSSLDYSGLGTVAFRKHDYKGAITNLDQAVKLGGTADPVNYYLLGKANEAETNFSEALAAYTKCAAISGPMQAPCQSSIADVKAHGAVLPK
jgi:tetratricopeptide (TPR) repeat protein